MSTRSENAALPILFCDRGCPYAHRVLALLEHLGQPFERREVQLGAQPAGLEQYSASGRLPLLVHADISVTESRVMLEHLAEYYGFAEAYPAQLHARTRHRYAMAVMDDYLAPLLFRKSVITPNPTRLKEALDALEVATATGPPLPGLLAMHLAPIWRGFRAWRPQGTVTRAIEARTPLRQWLDDAADLPCVARPAVDPKILRADVERAREAGLLPTG